MKAHVRNTVERIKGQVLILMALLMTTLIIFFGMVVNIGHLVQAKINLQNAVDLAAMAGASWQARYLNHLALINYRMRQNYKFVLFDIYVTQSRHNKGFQQQVTSRTGFIGPFEKVQDPRTPGTLALGICQTIPGYEPSTPEEFHMTTLRFPSISTDFCRLISPGHGFFSRLPDAPFIPIPMGGAIVAAQVAANRALEENCKASSGQNGAYFQYIIRHLRDRNLFQMEEMSKILMHFNQSFNTGPELTPVMSGGNAGAGDVSIFRTFMDNLITANRDGAFAESLVYLNPPETRTFLDEGFASDPSVLIGDAEPAGNFTKYFERQMVGFSLSVIDSRWTGSGCQFSPHLMQAGEPHNPSRPGFVFLGLSRARQNSGLGEQDYRALKVPFQVVLRATVQPKLLFWPRNLTPTLVAVGAAKPFGSRMAPPIENVAFEVSGSMQRRALGEPANISFYPGDIRSGGNEFPGVGHVRVLKYLEQALRTPAGQMRVAANSHGQMTPERPSIVDSSFRATGAEYCRSQPMPFICSALMPTLYEGLLWTVFPDPAKMIALNSSQAAEYPSEYSLPIGGGGSDPDINNRLQKMGFLYYMPDRMRGSSGSLGPRTALWHVSTLLPPQAAGIFSNSGKPLFYANETSAGSAFNPDWDPQNMDTALGSALDGRRGYQIRLISMDQACEELEKSDGIRPGSTMQSYCRGDGAVYQ